MPQPGQDVLAAYLEADAKYVVAPLPTSLEDEVERVVEFIEQRATRDQTARRTQRLAHLAVYYDTQPVVPRFEAMLNRSESTRTDYFRSAYAIVAVAWIGTQADWSKAQHYYHTMLERAEPLEHRVAILVACEALGPDEGTHRVRDWIRRAITELEEKQAAAARAANEDEADDLWTHAENLKDFVNKDVALLDEANKIRKQLAERPPPAQAARMVPLYSGDASDTTEGLRFWAAMHLVRIARQSPRSRSLIAERFWSLAKSNDRDDPVHQPECDMRRLRSLWAADLFGYELPAESRDWAQGREDPGTDILALRRDWAYPTVPPSEEEEEEEEEKE